MKIIGFNLHRTTYGLPLDNGGVCLIIDGKVKMMINEERLNRVQYSAGFAMSLEYILKNNNLTIEDIDLFVASSCLEKQLTANQIKGLMKEQGFYVPVNKIKSCDHHVSHGLTAYYPSGFDEAIVMVLDGDGNSLGEIKPGTQTMKKYWQNKFAHNSYFIGKGNELKLLERDEIGAKENGFGGAYRYFTYFCGFPGYKYAGKLMGLSAYGSKRNRFKDIMVFETLPNGQVKCLLKDSDRFNSSAVVEKWLKKRGINIKARKLEEPITHDIEDVAFLIQRELDRVMIHKVNYLVEKTGITNLCIAGGVGLNAVTNKAILDNTPIKNIYIQPACGDSGQCLGNAYYAMAQFDKKHLRRERISVYQGKEYSQADILKALQYAEEPIKYTKMNFTKLSKLAAKKIKQNQIIGWFQGRSEIGPRALGNRSILANPINPKMKDILNARVKHREPFRPFAPSVLEDEASKWFELAIPAPYMIINAQVKQPKRIPSATHYDGSARLQTVSRVQKPRYYSVINDFKKLTGVPVVINTSLNDNESIVETPRDAVNLFLRTGMDYLFIGDYFVEKDKSLDSREKSLQVIENKWSKILASVAKFQNAKSLVLDRKIVEVVQEHAKPGAKIFDYNSEIGEYANLLTKHKYDVIGYNVHDETVAIAKRRYKKIKFLNKKQLFKSLHTLEGRFDIVMSNLWLCILTKSQHSPFLKNLRKLAGDNGKIIISFCHPCFDLLPESIVTHRDIPRDAKYSQEVPHRKIVHENGLEFKDFHRPLSYYTELFEQNGLKIVDIAESKVLGTNYFPDFIIFTLEKIKD